MKLKGKNQGLGHYIGKMNKETFLVYHSKFSNAPEIAMLTLRVLSRVVGSQPLSFKSEKIILIEKAEAVRVFGHHPLISASRAGYFTCLTGYALACMDKPAPKMIGWYKKQEFLRYRGKIIDPEKPSTAEDDHSDPV